MSALCLLYSYKGIAGVSEQRWALGLVCYSWWVVSLAPGQAEPKLMALNWDLSQPESCSMVIRCSSDGRGSSSVGVALHRGACTRAPT